MVTSATLALLVAAPVAASANPLLSGYGGPGQGDQAILGATLLNGPGSGDGSAGTGEAASESAAALTATEGAAAQGDPNVAHRSASGHARRGRTTATSPSKAVSRKPPSAVLAQLRLRSDSVGSSGVLGLSGADILYILLTLAALALVGGFTRQLARQPH